VIYVIQRVGTVFRRSYETWSFVDVTDSGGAVLAWKVVMTFTTRVIFLPRTYLQIVTEARPCEAACKVHKLRRLRAHAQTPALASVCKLSNDLYLISFKPLEQLYCDPAQVPTSKLMLSGSALDAYTLGILTFDEDSKCYDAEKCPNALGLCSATGMWLI
jgi:hypothetical protein